MPGDWLDQQFQQEAAALATEWAENEAFSSLLSKKALISRQQKQLEEDFASFRRQQNAGAALLGQALNSLAREHPELFSENTYHAIGRIVRLSIGIRNDEKGFLEKFSRGATLQEIAGTDEETMNTLYLAAKSYYDEQLFTDAALAFRFLCSLSPKKYLFWLGVAHAEYYSGQYKEAVDAYKVVIQANPKDPLLHLLMSRCYRALGEHEKSIEALDLALKEATDAKLRADIVEEKIRLMKRGKEDL